MCRNVNTIVKKNNFLATKQKGGQMKKKKTPEGETEV
jgi:hypothetical protein